MFTLHKIQSQILSRCTLVHNGRMNVVSMATSMSCIIISFRINCCCCRCLCCSSRKDGEENRKSTTNQRTFSTLILHCNYKIKLPYSYILFNLLSFFSLRLFVHSVSIHCAMCVCVYVRACLCSCLNVNAHCKHTHVNNDAGHICKGCQMPN